jgi:hypothetical protein
VPHPGIEQRRVRTVQASFDRPMPIEADGVAVGSASRIEINVVPDAFGVVV